MKAVSSKYCTKLTRRHSEWLGSYPSKRCWKGWPFHSNIQFFSSGHSPTWNSVSNYVKAPQCPAHPSACVCIGPPVRLNGFITSANQWRKFQLCYKCAILQYLLVSCTFNSRNLPYVHVPQMNFSPLWPACIHCPDATNSGCCIAYCRIHDICVSLSP
jgi:hypothetical protein